MVWDCTGAAAFYTAHTCTSSGGVNIFIDTREYATNDPAPGDDLEDDPEPVEWLDAEPAIDFAAPHVQRSRRPASRAPPSSYRAGAVHRMDGAGANGESRPLQVL